MKQSEKISTERYKGKSRSFDLYIISFINKITTWKNVWGGLKKAAFFLFNLLQIALIIWLWTTFGVKGIGYIIAVSLFIIIVLRWKEYKQVIWWVFKSIFGKYPEEFKKGELKKVKFKFVKVHKDGKSDN